MKVAQEPTNAKYSRTHGCSDLDSRAIFIAYGVLREQRMWSRRKKKFGRRRRHTTLGWQVVRAKVAETAEKLRKK